MYSGLQYSHVVYEGFLPGAPSATGGDTPGSNVRDYDDSLDRLGCGSYNFFLTGRCATTGVLCQLDAPLVSGKYDRRLDDVSEAELVFNFSGDATFTCCECLAEAEPWCYELHIWRDGEEVWVGPIQTIEYTYDTITIRARDSFAWMGVRYAPTNVDFSAGGTDLTDQALFIIDIAFSQDVDYSCELNNIYSEATGFTFGTFFEMYKDTTLEMLRQLGDMGLNFTALGRTIVLTSGSTPLTPLILLNDSHIMGEIKVTKDGERQGNVYYVHFDGDGGTPASSTPVDQYCYGPIERMRDNDPIESGIDAAAIADEYVEAGAIAPRTMEVPSGSQLSPDTPWRFNEMVPGARVDVAVTTLCLNMTQSFLLTQVEVELSADDGEQIGITVMPINSVGSE